MKTSKRSKLSGKKKAKGKSLSLAQLKEEAFKNRKVKKEYDKISADFFVLRNI